MASYTSVISSHTTPLKFGIGKGLASSFFFDSDKEAKISKQKMEVGIEFLDMDNTEEVLNKLFPLHRIGSVDHKHPFVEAAEEMGMSLVDVFAEGKVMLDADKATKKASPITSIDRTAAWIAQAAPNLTPEELFGHVEALLMEKEAIIKCLQGSLNTHGRYDSGYIKFRKNAATKSNVEAPKFITNNMKEVP
jgi:hypothetical protein